MIGAKKLEELRKFGSGGITDVKLINDIYDTIEALQKTNAELVEALKLARIAYRSEHGMGLTKEEIELRDSYEGDISEIMDEALRNAEIKQNDK